MTADQIAHLLADLKAGKPVAIETAIPGASLHYLPWFPSDFYGNPVVEALSDRAQNWYRRLLDKSWQMPEPCFLPNDLTLLAGMCRCTPLDLQGEGVFVLAKFSKTEDGKYLFNRRMLKEYLECAIPYMKQVEAGRETARKRWSKDKSPSSSPISVATSQADTNQNHNQNYKELKPSPTPPLRTEYEFTPSAAARFVTVELGLGGDRLLATISDVIRAESERLPIDPKDVAETMVAVYRKYQESPRGKSKFACKASTFFGEGIWKQNPTLWELIDGTHGTNGTNAADERKARNRKAILAGMGLDVREVDGTPQPSAQDGLGGGDGPVMEGVVSRVSS
jgi:hypothetical protein